MVRGRPSSRTRRTYAHVADGFSFDYPQDCGGLAHRLRPASGSPVLLTRSTALRLVCKCDWASAPA